VNTYELTSGGTALMEKNFAGTPHEMVSMYHVQGNNVVMTHYCMIGNHPTLRLKKADAKTWEFEMQGHEGLGSKDEPHMHALKVTWIDSNHIRQEWTSFEKGTKKETKSFEMTRKN